MSSKYVQGRPAIILRESVPVAGWNREIIVRATLRRSDLSEHSQVYLSDYLSTAPLRTRRMDLPCLVELVQ